MFENSEGETGRAYERIAPTAWGVAYERAYSDIPYAKEILEELGSVVNPSDPLQADYMDSVKRRSLAPQFEARFKLINRLFEENKTDQVLELAAGLASRGLILTDKYPDLEYVELDLPSMVSSKRQLLQDLYSKKKAVPREGLRVVDGDALSYESLAASVADFEQKPITVINEGLLRYLNMKQKAEVARNVHMLLQGFGGTWITSDITTKQVLTYQEERMANRARVKRLTGIDVGDNSFDDFDAAEVFFNNLGFSVERRLFTEVTSELVSPKKQGVSDEDVEKMLRSAVVFVMRLK
jgi:O-methyltransferase involved in polyketide biosynthesis